MFNRNEWLQWAKQSQTSNPEMQDFRNEYWRKNDATRGYLYENSEQQVDEGLMKDLDKGFRSAGRWITGKKEGKPLTRRQLTDRMKQHYDKSKKVVVDKDTRDKAIAGLKSAGSHALVGAIYAKTGGPSKEEKEQQKKMSPTRLGTQQPEEPTKESVELDEFTVPGYDQDKTLKANMPKWRKDADKRTREQSKKVKVRKTRPLTNPMKPADESVELGEANYGKPKHMARHKKALQIIKFIDSVEKHKQKWTDSFGDFVKPALNKKLDVNGSGGVEYQQGRGRGGWNFIISSEDTVLYNNRNMPWMPKSGELPFDKFMKLLDTWKKETLRESVETGLTTKTLKSYMTKAHKQSIRGQQQSGKTIKRIQGFGKAQRKLSNKKK